MWTFIEMIFSLTSWIINTFGRKWFLVFVFILYLIQFGVPAGLIAWINSDTYANLQLEKAEMRAQEKANLNYFNYGSFNGSLHIDEPFLQSNKYSLTEDGRLVLVVKSNKATLTDLEYQELEVWVSLGDMFYTYTTDLGTPPAQKVEGNGIHLQAYGQRLIFLVDGSWKLKVYWLGRY